MKQFTDADVLPSSAFDGWIQADRSELVDAPMWYHKQGLQQTASGYGRKLNSGLKIHFNGKLYRIYVTIFSNAGTSWFTAKGKRYSVS